jgi:hypothetical protein
MASPFETILRKAKMAGEYRELDEFSFTYTFFREDFIGVYHPLNVGIV